MMNHMLRKYKTSKVIAGSLVLATLAAVCGTGPHAAAQAVQFIPTLTSVAGGGSGTCANATDAFGDGCVGSATKLSGVRAMAIDPQGNLVFTDTGDNLIRRWNAQTGLVTVVAGGAAAVCTGATDAFGDGCPATQALLNNDRGVAVDTAGNIYISDNSNNIIREVSAQTGIITVFAGGGTVCTAKTDSVGDGCPATQATLSGPTSVTVDPAGNVYISDYTNDVVRKVSASTGIITLIAGKLGSKCASAAACGDGGAATSAQLNSVYGIGVDSYGNVYLVDHADYRVRMVTASTGIITTIAGSVGDTSTTVSSGNGGPATASHIQNGYNLVVDESGNIYLADSGVAQIREIIATTGGPTPVFGNIILYAGGQATVSSYPGDGNAANNTDLNTVYGDAIDNQGNLYVSDEGHGRILRVSLNNAFASTAVATSLTQSLVAQTNSADTLNSAQTSTVGEFAAVLQTDCAAGTAVAAGIDCDLATTFTPKYAGLRRSPLTLSDSAGADPTVGLIGIGLAPSVVFTPGTIADTAGTGTAGYSGDTGLATSAKLTTPSMSVYDANGNLFIADTGNSVVRRVDAVSGNITTVAGTGTAGYSGDGSAATAATLKLPQGVAVDAAGNLFIADTGNNVVREVSVTTGKIATIAGSSTGTAGFSGDNSAATAATLRAPAGVAVDAAGDVFIADTGNNAVREVLSTSGFITTIAGSSTGVAGNSGTGGLGRNALLSAPTGLFWQPNGTLTIANVGSNTVSQLNLYNSIVTTVAGTGSAGFGGDTGPATAAQLQKPADVALDAAGDIYIADTGNARVRRIDASTGIISTVAGNGTPGRTGDSGSATAAELNGPSGIALDSTWNLLITDGIANVVRRVDVSHGATLNFGSQATYTTSATQVLSLTNAGNQALTFTGISVAANFQQEAVGSSDCASTTVLAVGGTCTLGIAFVPQSAGTINGSVVTTDNNLLQTGATQTTSLSGTSVLTTNKLSITGLGTTTTAGASQSLTVTALANSTVVTNYTGTVSFTSTDSAAVLPATYTFTLADHGVHTFTGVVLKTAGPQSITVTDATNSLTASISTTVTAGAAASITAVAGGNQTTKVSTAFTVAFKALVKDAYGNIVPGASVSFSAPGVGASGTFTGGSTSTTVTADGTGTATAPTFTANATVGSYNVSALVAGVSTPATFALTNVANQYTTTTTLAVTPSGTQTYGQSLLLTATESPSTQSGATATGTVLFFDNGVQLPATPTISNGSASTTVALPTIGMHSYTATYSGDTNFAGSTSVASVVVITKATTTLSGQPVSVNYGQAGTATVTVTGQHAGAGVALPTGTVTYQIGSGTPGTANLVSGVASIPIPATLASGTYTLTVTYNGDSNYVSGGMTTLTITVNKLTSAATVTSSLNPANLNASIVLTATVKPVGTSSAFPTGSVTFYDGTTLLMTVNLNTSGVATYTTSTLAAGSHNITVVYSGDANFGTTTSPILVQVVAAPGLSISASPTSFTVVQGSYGSTTLTLTPAGGLTDTVALSCSGLPAYSSCVFNIATANMPQPPLTAVVNGVYFPGTNAPITVGLSVATRGSQGVLGELNRPEMGGGSRRSYVALLGWPCLLLAGIGLMRRSKTARRHLPLLGLLLLLGGGLIAGCGNGTQTPPIPTPAGTYSILVTATGTSTTVTQSTTVSVTVVP